MPAGSAYRPPFRAHQPDAAGGRPEGWHRVVAAGGGGTGQCAVQGRVFDLYLWAPADRGADGGQDRLRVTGNTPPIFGAATKARVKVVSEYEGGGLGDQILAHSDSPIHSVADLRARISLRQGEFGPRQHPLSAAKFRLSPSDVQLVFLQPADALSALSQGQADAWAIWDPYTAQADSSQVRTLATRPVRERFWIRGRLRWRWGTPNAIPHCPTCWCGLRWQSGGPKPIHRTGLKIIPPQSVSTPHVAALSQARSLRQPTALTARVSPRSRSSPTFSRSRGRFRASPTSRTGRSRFNDRLNPGLITEVGATSPSLNRPHIPYPTQGEQFPWLPSSSGPCLPTVTAGPSWADRMRPRITRSRGVPRAEPGYLAEIARAADRLGFEGVLTPPARGVRTHGSRRRRWWKRPNG